MAGARRPTRSWISFSLYEAGLSAGVHAVWPRAFRTDSRDWPCRAAASVSVSSALQNHCLIIFFPSGDQPWSGAFGLAILAGPTRHFASVSLSCVLAVLVPLKDSA